ncbi:MAG: L,D-transpeptidase, partial [Myxococcota bacterium]|nr:L,D-transpeptidase [Myxococcota bacterium]
VVAKPSARGGPGVLDLVAGPHGASARRGVTLAGATLPLFGAKRGSGCTGAWWLVGPLAWTCSDLALLSREPEPDRAATPTASEAIARDYFFVRTPATAGYDSLEAAQEREADRELEAGWGVAVVEQRTAGDERWARTTKGIWIAARDLVPARASTFHGEPLPEGKLDVAWVRADRARVWSSPARTASRTDAPRDMLVRFQVVHVREEAGPFWRISDESAGAAEQWVLGADLARPTIGAPPAEVTRPRSRWIDVELASQTLVAYVGERPVYATIVSTGRGSAAQAREAPPEVNARTGTATPRGVHHVWVKLLGSDMSDVARDDTDAHYSLDEVPYVQFFDNAVALHGTYWHGDFGREHSHGCVNLAPKDARWLFDFTGPRLPTGWAAAYPSAVDEGTLVRVR